MFLFKSSTEPSTFILFLPKYSLMHSIYLHPQPVEFSACKKVSPLKKLSPNATICAMCLNNLA